MHTKKLILILVTVLSLAIVFTACEGPMGPQGERGESVEGPQGPVGEDGQDGADAGNYLDVGAFQSEFINESLSRGLYFQSPVNFTIQDIQVYESIGGDVQNIAVVRFDDEPEFWPSTTNDFEVLYYETNLPSDEKVIVNIEVSAGDHIGILGTRGTLTMHNAYGPESGYQSSIKGVPVTLYRLGMQSNLNNTAPASLFASDQPISLVHLRYF